MSIRATAGMLGVLAAIGACAAGGGAGSDDLVVRDAWSGPGDAVAAVYLTIDNGGAADRLVEVRTDVAGSVGVMGEEAGAGSHTDTDAPVDLAVPSGSLELAPAGRHVMLSDLAEPLEPGDRFTLTLRFARSGTRRVEVEVVGWDEVVDRYDSG